jgi:hypothetical protein
MYAARKLCVVQSTFDKPKERYTVKLMRGGKPVPGIQADRISTVEEEVMYWRKANHIHNWFVEHVQDGVDDQRSYYVSWEQLEHLLDDCKKVIEASELIERAEVVGTGENGENPSGTAMGETGKVIKDPTVAKSLLPTQQGFFFGSYDYDEHYLNDVVETRDWVQRMLDDHRNGVPGDIYYSCWW